MVKINQFNLCAFFKEVKFSENLVCGLDIDVYFYCDKYHEISLK